MVTRAFQYGTVAYNLKGNGPATVSFAEPMQSIATTRTATEHKLSEEDGDIYVPVNPAKTAR